MLRLLPNECIKTRSPKKLDGSLVRKHLGGTQEGGTQEDRAAALLSPKGLFKAARAGLLPDKPLECPSFLPIVQLLSHLNLCQSCSCIVSGLIISALARFLQRKETLCILWVWELPTHFWEGHQTHSHTK